MNTPETSTKPKDKPVGSSTINTVDIFKDFNPEDYYEPGFSYDFLKELSRRIAEGNVK